MNESSETQRDLMIRSGKITPFNDESLLDNRPVHTFFGHQKRKHDSVEETEEEPDEYSDASQTDDDADDNSATSDEPPDEEDYQDDGTLERYRQRINSWLGRQDSRIEMSDALFEYHGLYSPDADARFDESFRLPGQVYERLFGYQRIGVKWLWELCQQKVGGIVGDEMGLGKTVNTLFALNHS